MDEKGHVSRRWLLKYTAAAGAISLAGCQETANAGKTTEPTPQSETDPNQPPTPTQAATNPPPPTTTHEQGWEAPVDLCQSNPSLRSSEPLKADFISREKYKCAGQPLDNFTTLDPWTADAGSLATIDSEAYNIKDASGAELQITPSQKRVQISRRFNGGVDLSNLDLSIGTRLLTPMQETIIVQLLAPDQENTVKFHHPLRSNWGWVRLDLGATNEIGTPDLTNVHEIRIGLYTGSGPAARLLVDSLRVTPKAETGRVVLTFDDNAITHHATALPLLEDYGHSAVVGVDPWDVGDTTADMSLDQLVDLQAAGWDVVSYPTGTEHFFEMAPIEQEERIRTAKQWLIEQGFDAGARFLIWPSTKFDHNSLQIASHYHYLGFTGARSPSGQLLSSPTKITRIQIHDISLADLKRLLRLADQHNHLIVLSSRGIGHEDAMVREAKFQSILEILIDSDLSVATASMLWGQLPK